MSLSVKVGGTWHNAIPSVRVGGAWRTVVQGFVRVAGTWRPFFTNSGSQVFTFTGGDQGFTVPPGATSVLVKMWGGGGGGGFNSLGGGAGFQQARIAVTAGELLIVKVGGAGRYGYHDGVTVYPNGGPSRWDGAGEGGGTSSVSKTGVLIAAAGGGGASDGNTGYPSPSGQPGGGYYNDPPVAAGGGGRFENGAAGGSNCGTGGTELYPAQGSNYTAGNSTDPDCGGSGRGGYNGDTGTNGKVIISW